MKAWFDINSVPMPSRILALPQDSRGYPIPVTAATRQDGTRDFKVIAEEVSHHCMAQGLCGVCGQSLGRFRCFVGGPRSIVQHLFFDAWMHRDCAEYSLMVCPFLAAPKFAYSRAEHTGHALPVVYESVSTERPQVFGLGVTAEGARYGYVNGGERVIQAGAWAEVSWWCKGKRITQEEVKVLLGKSA